MISVTATTLADIDYPIMSGVANSPPFDAFTVVPSYCVISYDFSVLPALPNPSSISLDTTTRIFTFSETNLDNEGVYTITIKAYNYELQDTGAIFSFNVDFQDLCDVSSIAVTASVLADINYPINSGLV